MMHRSSVDPHQDRLDPDLTRRIVETARRHTLDRSTGRPSAPATRCTMVLWTDCRKFAGGPGRSCLGSQVHPSGHCVRDASVVNAMVNASGAGVAVRVVRSTTDVTPVGE